MFQALQEKGQGGYSSDDAPKASRTQRNKRKRMNFQ